MAVPIRHKDCGEIVMWYMGDRENSFFRSSDVVYLDGSRPLHGSRVPLCPHCGKIMAPSSAFGGQGNLVRCFDEDIDPGFDMRANAGGKPTDAAGGRSA